jgi:hypothetical protein
VCVAGGYFIIFQTGYKKILPGLPCKKNSNSLNEKAKIHEENMFGPGVELCGTP